MEELGFNWTDFQANLIFAYFFRKSRKLESYSNVTRISGKTLQHLKNQPVNAVKGGRSLWFRDPHKTHKLCGQNVGLLNVKPSGTYSDLWALNDTLGTPLRSNQSIQPPGRWTVGLNIKRLLSHIQRSCLYKIIRILDIILIYTYCMVRSPSWEGNWFAASQEIPRLSNRCTNI